MRAKKVDFEVTYITADSKPDWFLEISPHGKVPVLKVDDDVLFESNAIAEFLDEMVSPQLHPTDPIKRARNRAWTDFTTGWAGALGKVAYAKTKEDQAKGLEDLPKTLTKIEDSLSRRENDGPYFNGDTLCLVDAAYAPFLMRFNMVEAINPTNVLDDFPKIKAWSEALLSNEAVINSVSEDFDEVFKKSLHRRESLAAQILDEQSAAAE
ncbi:MAG: glutathione S-transferase family protein [Rhodospirillaceae bacterium]|jgi:glutathione S-transferase|nr:glutathione S-transferase family protein [Rhodospirillaceae bacterium]MBT7268046.1 glutathione S-transferase family protein [Rhodospirillaceae bacterium]